MEAISRQKFLRYLGLGSAGLLLPQLALSRGISAEKPTPKTGSSLRVAHLTDIHIEAGKEAEHGFAAALEAVNSLPEPPDFILNGGDAIMNSALNLSREKVKSQWELFHQILRNHNSLPVNHCLGNHDLYGWTSPDLAHTKGKNWAMEEYQLSSSYYALEKGKWKFIVLDSIHGRNSVPGYYACLDEAQLGWLEAELKATPPDQFICIVSHIPILAVCTLFDGKNQDKEHWRIPNNTLHADARELTALFYKFPQIKACLSGHIHLIDHVHYLSIDYFCNGAVSGSWWKGNYHEFPPSFSVMNFSDTGQVTREIICYNWQASN